MFKGSDFLTNCGFSLSNGDTSGGSKGMRAAVLRTRPAPIMLALDSAGTGMFRMHPDRPTLLSHAGPPAEPMVWRPATLIAGQTVELGLAAVDANSNPAPFNGEVELRITKGAAKLPSAVRFQSREGWMSVPFVPEGTGIHRVEARVIHEANMDKANPLVPRDMPHPGRVGGEVVRRPGHDRVNACSAAKRVRKPAGS